MAVRTWHPLAEAVAKLDEQRRDALERDVCDRWQEHVVDGALALFGAHDDGDRPEVGAMKPKVARPVETRPSRSLDE